MNPALAKALMGRKMLNKLKHKKKNGHHIIKSMFKHPMIWFYGILTLFVIIVITMLIFSLLLLQTPPSGHCRSGGSSGLGDVNIGGVNGSWTKKGTKEYNEAKAIYVDCIKYGMDSIHAGAVTGNAGHESWYFTGGLKREQVGGGGGAGVFQFTGQTPKYGWSPIGQVKSIMANSDSDYGGHHWMKSSGSLDELTNSFEETFERGDPEFGSRDAIAHQIMHMFGHIGAGASSDVDDSSDSGSKCSGSSSTSGNYDDIIKFASKYKGLAYGLGGNPVPVEEGKPKSDVNPTDCNKFAWAVLRHCGYAVPASVPGNCDNSQQRLAKYRVKASDTHEGSLAICHEHAMIMMSKWTGNSTPMAEEIPRGVTIGMSFRDSMLGSPITHLEFFNVPKR